jgi:hypothetical protein
MTPAQPTVAKRRDLSASLRPGAADERAPPVSFPLPPLARDPGLRSLLSAASPAPRQGAPTAAPPFFSFLPRRGPAPSRHPPAPCATPLCDNRRNRTARSLFPCTPTARAASPNPSRASSDAAMPPRVLARTPKSPSRSRSRTLGPPHKNPTVAARSPNHPRPFSLSAVAAPKRGREGGGGAVQEEEDQEPSEEDDAAAATGASPGRRPVRRLRRRRSSCTARTRLHQPTTTPSDPPASPR